MTDRHAANWQLHLRLDPDLKEPLEELARREDRSVSNLIGRILRQYVEQSARGSAPRA